MVVGEEGVLLMGKGYGQKEKRGRSKLCIIPSSTTSIKY